MTHEAVRIDHIGVMLEVYPNSRQNNAIFVKKILVNKAGDNLWNERTEIRFKDWNKKNIRKNIVR